ncbi:hypothetical protein NLG97_g10372 [Lecanicillium saksenae]|uniref:Uncharacterized protein n=1 Tax=Lecanicillium saksenae TaxID=468837 RepID=A0ACC1QDC8_9HYPO|nr:hypothetical protein NLG97_g10372 [Lecanicillium saksenae]
MVLEKTPMASSALRRHIVVHNELLQAAPRSSFTPPPPLQSAPHHIIRPPSQPRLRQQPVNIKRAASSLAVSFSRHHHTLTDSNSDAMAAVTQDQPQQLPPVFNHTPETIASETEDLLTRSKAIYDKVVAETTVENATFENTLHPILELDNILDPVGGILAFYQNVHTDAAIREASMQADQKMSELAVELRMHEGIFQRVNTIYKNRESSGLDPEARHIVEKEYKRYANAGLLLPAGPKRDRFKEIQLELNRLCIEARNNANAETGGIYFTAEELDGVPKDDVNVDELEKGTGENEGKFKVGFKPNIQIPLMEHATRAETRRDYYIAKENKLNINTPLFKKILLLRDEGARLVGYKDHASLRLSEKMAETSDNVNKFLSDMLARAGKGVKNDIAGMLKHKKADYEARGLEFDGELYVWDLGYYERILKEKETTRAPS